MKTPRLIRVLALALFAAAAIYFAAIYPMLPDRIAVHYDFYGHPNGWGSKLSFAMIMCGTFGGLNVLLLGVVPLLLRITPGWMINFPTRRMKAYWTATPERLSVAKARMLSALPIILVPMNLLFLLIVQVAYQDHVPDPILRVPFLPALWTALALVFLGAVVMTVCIYRSLRIPPDDAQG